MGPARRAGVRRSLWIPLYKTALVQHGNVRLDLAVSLPPSFRRSVVPHVRTHGSSSDTPGPTGVAAGAASAGGAVTRSVRRKGGDAPAIVADTSVGIGSSERDRLFERFYRADSPQVRAEIGNGLAISPSDSPSATRVGSPPRAAARSKGARSPSACRRASPLDGTHLRFAGQLRNRVLGRVRPLLCRPGGGAR